MNRFTLGTALVAAIALGAVGALRLSDLFTPKSGIILRATNTEIGSEKWIAIEGVLKAASVTKDADPREKLYRVREFNNGDPVGEMDEGTLDKIALLDNYEQTFADLKEKNFTGHALQIGVGDTERSKHIPNNALYSPQAHHRLNILESKEMVKEVDKVLNGP